MQPKTFAKAKALAEFVRQYKGQFGVPPSFSEIASALGCTVQNIAKTIVPAAKDAGLVRARYGARRGLEVVE